MAREGKAEGGGEGRGVRRRAVRMIDRVREWSAKWCKVPS